MDVEGKNVRARIDAIVDAREAEAGGTAEKPRRKRFSKLAKLGQKKVVIILSVMGVVIIGLAIAILAVKRPWESGTSGSCNGNAETAEEVAERVRTTIENIVAEANNMPFDEAVEFLDKKIAEYNNTEYEYGVIMTKIYLLLNNGEGKAAFVDAEKIEDLKLTSEEALDYYSVMMKIYREMGDETMMVYYQDMYAGAYDDLYGEGMNDGE